MQTTEELLRNTAEVLDKMAAVYEAQETDRMTAETARKTAEAQKIAESLSGLTGEELGDGMVEKLSELSPEISALLQKVAGEGVVDSLGGPSRTEKVASIRGRDGVAAAVAAADARYVNWLSTQ
jgi:hypothetical protein